MRLTRISGASHAGAALLHTTDPCRRRSSALSPTLSHREQDHQSSQVTTIRSVETVHVRRHCGRTPLRHRESRAVHVVHRQSHLVANVGIRAARIPSDRYSLVRPGAAGRTPWTGCRERPARLFLRQRRRPVLHEDERSHRTVMAGHERENTTVLRDVIRVPRGR
jgi:hypothetical protein